MKTQTVTIDTSAGISVFELTHCTKTRPADYAWKITTLVLHGIKQPAGCGLMMFSDTKEELMMFARQSAEQRTSTKVNLKFKL